MDMYVRMYDELSLYKKSKGVEYKSDFATIKRWVIISVDEKEARINKSKSNNYTKDSKKKSFMEYEQREYPLFSKQIEELELSKLQGVESDINSSIKSKNSLSSVTENEAIKNIATDTKIESILKWKLIIDYVFKVIKSKDEFKYDVLAYKYIAHLTEHDIENKLYIARNSIRKYIDEFIIEISYLAIDEGLIKIEKIQIKEFIKICRI